MKTPRSINRVRSSSTLNASATSMAATALRTRTLPTPPIEPGRRRLLERHFDNADLIEPRFVFEKVTSGIRCGAAERMAGQCGFAHQGIGGVIVVNGAEGFVAGTPLPLLAMPQQL